MPEVRQRGSGARGEKSLEDGEHDRVKGRRVTLARNFRSSAGGGRAGCGGWSRDWGRRRGRRWGGLHGWVAKVKDQDFRAVKDGRDSRAVQGFVALAGKDRGRRRKRHQCGSSRQQALRVAQRDGRSSGPENWSAMS